MVVTENMLNDLSLNTSGPSKWREENRSAFPWISRPRR